MLGLRLAKCGTTILSEDRGIDRMDDPPPDDRCAACQGAFVRGEATASTMDDPTSEATRDIARTPAP